MLDLLSLGYNKSPLLQSQGDIKYNVCTNVQPSTAITLLNSKDYLTLPVPENTRNGFITVSFSTVQPAALLLYASDNGLVSNSLTSYINSLSEKKLFRLFISRIAVETCAVLTKFHCVKN